MTSQEIGKDGDVEEFHSNGEDGERSLDQVRSETSVLKEQLDQIRLEWKDMQTDLRRQMSNSGEPRSPAWKVELERFAESTTMHGAPQMILSKHPLRKLAWIIIFFASWGMFIWQTVLVCDNYFKYPTKTEMKILRGNIPFPAVTFCPHGVVGLYAVHDWKMRYASSDDTLAYDSHFFYSKLYHIHPTFLSRESNTFLERYYVSKDEFFVFVDSHSEERNSGSERIYSLDVDEVAGGQFYRCFKVQMPNKEEGVELSKYELTGEILSGDGSDLDMTFKKKSGFPWMYQERGPVRVFFHQQGTVVDPQTNPNYIDIHPGTEVRFNVKAKRTIRVGLPHGNCSNFNPYLRDKNVVYQQNECMDHCFNDQLLRRKKMVSAHHPMLEGLHCWEGAAWNRTMHGMYAFAKDMKYVKHWCNKSIEGAEDGANFLPVSTHWSFGGFTFDQGSCPCHQPCDDIEYVVRSDIKNKKTGNINNLKAQNLVTARGNMVLTNYSGRFRNGEFLVQMSNGSLLPLELSGGNDIQYSFIDNYIKNNTSKVLSDIVSFSIGIVDDDLPTTIETPLYTRAQLISEIGGQLGIWIGVSVITLTEVVELLVSIICKCLR